MAFQIPQDAWKPPAPQKEAAIQVISSKAEMQAHSLAARARGETIVFVPTMGFLHKGHESLMHLGLRHGNHLVVSIFVNPAQFGPNEDLEKYPRDLPRDLALCERAGAAVVYTPQPPEVYGPGFATWVNVDGLPDHLCGLSRPGHFRGVATVVAKLFNTVLPHAAVFGEKDFQQLAVLRRMTLDLDFPIRIIPGPTVREEDGLAMSSRNKYLSEAERKVAPVLFRSLARAKEQVAQGEKDAGKIIREAEKEILAKPGTRIDYVKICDPGTLDDLAAIAGPAVMALAVFVGTTRLIDNMMISPPPGP
ncbi:MAG: pantoate--beta-alanine ligase [Thermodesulfobacteriota bacterium]